MKLEVKTCGLADEASIDIAVAAGATHLGFIHFNRSPRHIDMPAIARLVAHARGRARTVVVSVDADDELLDRIVAEAQPDMLQFHGSETPERVATWRDRSGLDTVKAIRVRKGSDVRSGLRYDGVVDRILFDAGPSQLRDLPGGNGECFNWDLLRAWKGGPFWLAGGINAGNVVQAIERVRPRGVDLSSGIEAQPGRKDPTKIRALFEVINASGRVGDVPTWRWAENSPPVVAAAE